MCHLKATIFIPHKIFSTSKLLPFSPWYISYFPIKFQAFFFFSSFNPKFPPQRYLSKHGFMRKANSPGLEGVNGTFDTGESTNASLTSREGCQTGNQFKEIELKPFPPSLHYTPHPKSLSITHTPVWSGQGSDFGKALRIFMNSGIPLCGPVNHSGLVQFPLFMEY